jgi:hypothetical protein
MVRRLGINLCQMAVAGAKLRAWRELITATGNPEPLKTAAVAKCQFALASTTIDAGSIANSSLTSVANAPGRLATFKILWIYGAVPQQRCWVHKMANILDKMPKSAFKQKPRNSSMKYIWRPPVKRLCQPTNNSFEVTRLNFRKPANFSKGQGKRYLLSTISRLSTGPTFGPSTRSSQPTRPSVCGPIVPRDLVPVWQQVMVDKAVSARLAVSQSSRYLRNVAQIARSTETSS